MTRRGIARLDIRKIRLVGRDDPELLALTAKHVRQHEKLGPAGENSAASELGHLIEGVVRGRLDRVIEIRRERHLVYEAQDPTTPEYEPEFIEFDAVAGSVEEGTLRFFEIKTTRNPKRVKDGLGQLRRLRSIVSKTRRVSAGLCLIWIDTRAGDREVEDPHLGIPPVGWDEMASLVNQPIVPDALASVVALSAAEAVEWAEEDGVPDARILWQRALAEQQEETPSRQRPEGMYSTGDGGGGGALGDALSEALEKRERR